MTSQWPGISYDGVTAAAYKAVRELPRDGLAEWREAVRRHLHPTQGTTLVDIGAGTGAFSSAFADFLGELDTFRQADTTMRHLTADEFLRGKELLRRAVESGDATSEPRSNGSTCSFCADRLATGEGRSPA